MKFNLGFGEAIHALVHLKNVTRASWSHDESTKGNYLFMVPGLWLQDISHPQMASTHMAGFDGEVGAYIAMVSGGQPGNPCRRIDIWTPSQSDMLCNDWLVLE